MGLLAEETMSTFCLITCESRHLECSRTGVLPSHALVLHQHRRNKSALQKRPSLRSLLQSSQTQHHPSFMKKAWRQMVLDGWHRTYSRKFIVPQGWPCPVLHHLQWPLTINCRMTAQQNLMLSLPWLQRRLWRRDRGCCLVEEW